MSSPDLDFQFAVISDLHVGLPHTIQDHPTRFHLVEWSIPVLERVLAHLCEFDLDFLLIPGDLTQHGEPENHQWLAQRLAALPFPAFVIPGNHDIPVPAADQTSIAPEAFPSFYQGFGYDQPHRMDYCQKLLPGVSLVGLNSNQFDPQGRQVGQLTQGQLQWLEATLASHDDDLILVMVHHNVLDHFPNQTDHPIGRRYMLENAQDLLEVLRRYGVQLVFTGHLHVQDIISRRGVVDITTGSLVSYPHPYRRIHVHGNHAEHLTAEIQSFRVESIQECDQVQLMSREWMGDRSEPFMMKMLTQEPLNFSPRLAATLAPKLRNFWSTVADGDPEFEVIEGPQALLDYLRSYEIHHIQPGEPILSDNHTTLRLCCPSSNCPSQ